MGTTPDLIPARFVVYATDRLDPTRTRRLLIEREPGTVTTTAQARAYVSEFLSPAWEIGSIIPVAEPGSFAHVLEALDAITGRPQSTAPAAPRRVTVPHIPCPGGVACQCHDEGLDR